VAQIPEERREKNFVLREEIVFSFVKTLLRKVVAGSTIYRVRRCLIVTPFSKVRLQRLTGFTILRVRRFSYVGKTSIFSMLLEGEVSMVRWPPIGLDLTRFSDLVGSS
jgi:hypothetical protein